MQSLLQQHLIDLFFTAGPWGAILRISVFWWLMWDFAFVVYVALTSCRPIAILKRVLYKISSFLVFNQFLSAKLHYQTRRFLFRVKCLPSWFLLRLTAVYECNALHDSALIKRKSESWLSGKPELIFCFLCGAGNSYQPKKWLGTSI